MRSESGRLAAILQAVLVTFLWSTSWVLIKFGLQDGMPALTFAGLRYSLAFLFLLPFALLNRREHAGFRSLNKSDWTNLLALGLVYYTITQGAQFLSLAYLPAASASLLLNLTPAVVAVLSIFFLYEQATVRQWLGIALAIFGVLLYFSSESMPDAHLVGIGISILGLLANSASALMARFANRRKRLSPILVTTISMGFGAVLLLASGLLTQGLGELSWKEWGIILWLALVNTAFAFTLWNHTLRTLTAVESSVINGLMLPQIAVLALIFLGEKPDERDIWGLLLVVLGTLIVQSKSRAKTGAEQS